MAIYPVLFIQYLRFFAAGLSRLDAWLLALALIWGATWLNLRGTLVVGRASGWFVATVLLPFGVLVGVAIARWIGQPATPFPVTPFHAAGSSFLGALGLGVSQSIWNYSGWDNASTIGGEIEHATATYPRALARALPLVTVVYLLSVIPILALTPWTVWTDGAWPDLAARVAGPWLGGWLAVAGMVSAFALFNALLLVYSRIPLVLAQDGLLPRALAATDARGTPRNAVLVSAVVYSVFALLPFGGLLAGDVLLYTAALALEFAALVRLRRVEPELRGAFRVPVGAPVLVALAALPVLLLVGGVALEVQSRAIGLPGVLALMLSALLGEHWTLPVSPRVWWAWAYLVVFGSLIAFSAYRFVVERVSATLASTYAYVNPPVALLVGWWLGHESFSPNILLGLPIVLGAVALHAWVQTRDRGNSADRGSSAQFPVVAPITGTGAVRP